MARILRVGDTMNEKELKLIGLIKAQDKAGYFGEMAQSIYKHAYLIGYKDGIRECSILCQSKKE